MYPEKINISERTLRVLHPAFAWLARHHPSRFAPPELPPLHPSAMLLEKNWIYNAIFPRFFKRISVEKEEIERLRQAAQNSTIVYIAKQMGHLEYNYYNHIFLKEGLPLSLYNNSMTLRRWMKWRDYWNAVISQESEIGKWGHTIDPLDEGMLPKMISEGKGVLIIIPPSGLADEELFLTGPIRSLTALVEAQRDSERPIKIVPLDFLWSRRPKKHKKSLVDILFGEKESPGMFRKTVLFCRNYKTQAHAAIGKPVNLEEFVNGANGSTDHDIAFRLREHLLSSLKSQRQTITGPPVRPRGWFIGQVMGDDELDERICAIAAERGKTAEDLRDLAKRYIREIAADVDYTYIELLDRILGSTLNRIYENYDVDTAGLKRARELYADEPVVFVPNHKSHVDYLILSHILYHNNMTVPHIAAGINLSFWPLGRIFRRCGAYFIRRQFRDNPLYKAVLETYLKILLKEGYSQEFFIEGGRSRTGKLRAPKKGMLSMLQGAARGAGISKVNFIPVSLTYDRIIEQKSLVSESEGETKEAEKTSHLLRLTKYLRPRRHRHGSIYVRFGEPVVMDVNAFEASHVKWVANDICHQINRRAVVTPVAVAAAALLAGARRAVTIAEFDSRVQLILQYLRYKGVELSARFEMSPYDVMQRAISQLGYSRLISVNRSFIEPYIAIDESKRNPLAFFKNGMVHFLATVGSISSIILACDRRGETLTRQKLSADFKALKDLFSHEFRFATRKPLEEHIDAALDFLLKKNSISISGDTVCPTRQGLWILEQFRFHIKPYLETLAIALQHIGRCATGIIDEKQLWGDMQDTGRDLLLLGRISHREAINKFDFQNTVRTLSSHRIIGIKEPETGRRRHNAYVISEGKDMLNKLQVELERVL